MNQTIINTNPVKPIQVYCEHNSTTSWVKELQTRGIIQLEIFAYDQKNKNIKTIAPPSAANWEDIPYNWEDRNNGFEDYTGTEMLSQIMQLMGEKNRRDCLHVDSAFKSGADCLLTKDSDILGHSEELEKLLGLKFFHAVSDGKKFKEHFQIEI